MHSLSAEIEVDVAELDAALRRQEPDAAPVRAIERAWDPAHADAWVGAETVAPRAYLTGHTATGERFALMIQRFRGRSAERYASYLTSLDADGNPQGKPACFEHERVGGEPCLVQGPAPDRSRLWALDGATLLRPDSRPVGNREFDARFVAYLEAHGE